MEKFNVNGYKKVYYANVTPYKSGMVILRLDKIQLNLNKKELILSNGNILKFQGT